jgi:hypothetical protein
MNTPKSAADTERQQLFESIRHYVGCKHQVPQHLSHADLMKALEILIGEKV